MIWDFWARFYEKLWVQKYSLGPTRRCIAKLWNESDFPKENKDFSQSDAKVHYLDMGCGTGQLIREMMRLFPFDEVYGMDFSKEMIAVAKNFQKEMPSAQNRATFLCANVEDLSKMDLPMFHLITCTHSLPYYRNQEKAVSDMADKLTKGGMLMIACASVNSFWDFLATFVLKITTGRAHYPSIRELKGFAKEKLKPVKSVRIRKKWYMPNIVVFVYEKKQ